MLSYQRVVDGWIWKYHWDPLRLTPDPASGGGAGVLQGVGPYKGEAVGTGATWRGPKKSQA
jgi:hypothetical protein